MKNELDCRGLQCPEPVSRCRNLLQTGQPALLQVIVDNAAALENVSRFLSRNGYAASSTHPSEKEWHITATKKGDAPLPEQSEKTSSGKTLVFLTSHLIGRGDDELGAKLMNMFLANLSELGNSLWRIILLNGAVKLSATEGPALQSLHALAQSGIGILVCGTCLTHYGLLEKKQVGETTNMMDIITSLGLAEKIIRP